MPDEPPKIIVDTDWKSQAQAEKEKLAQKAAPAKGAAGGPGAPGGEGPDAPATFDDIVRMLAMQALTFLGEVPDPVSNQRIFAPEYAKRYIDMLGILEEKTKGNLDQEQGEALAAVAADLRMAYVEIGKAVAKAIAEGKIKPSQMGGGGLVGGAGPIPGAGGSGTR